MNYCKTNKFKNAFYGIKWCNVFFPFKFFSIIQKNVNKGSNYFKMIYFIVKILQLIIYPIFLVCVYISRILLLYRVLFKNIFKCRFLPNKL